MSGDIKEMEVTDYGIVSNIKATLYRLWKLKLVPVFAACMGFLLAAAYLVYSGSERSYYASASIYSAVYGSYSDTVSGVSIMNNYSSILGSTRVCNRAAAEINDSSVTADLLASYVSSGNIYLSGASEKSKSYGYRLVLSTRLSTSPNVIKITNAMAHAFSSEINELLGSDIIQVFDEANHIKIITGTSRKLTALICAVAAFVLACGIICVKEFFSSKVYLVSQCEMDKDKILGIIPYRK